MAHRFRTVYFRSIGVIMGTEVAQSTETGQGYSRRTAFTLWFGAAVAVALGLYTVLSSFVPLLTSYVSYRVLILGMLTASGMPLAVFMWQQPNSCGGKDEDDCESSRPLRKEAGITLVFICLVTAYVLASSAFSWVINPAVTRILVLSAAFVSILCYFAIAKIARRRDLNLVVSDGRAQSDRIVHRFFTSLGIFLLFPVYIVAIFIFPSLQGRTETSIIFSGLAGSCLIGLWSVSKDIRELGNILEKASEVASGDMEELIETPRDGELAELANAFNVVIAERNETIRKLEEANKRAERLASRIRERALMDDLTGIHNRRFFWEEFNKEISRADRTGRSVAVAVLDVDNFKSYNDTFGHPAGDSLLKELAQLIQDNIRASDTLCRYGGDEFTVILSDVGEEGSMASEKAEKSIQRARKCVEKQDYGGGGEDRVTLSAGLAVYPEDGHSVEEMVRRADRRLYRAKRAGKNSLCSGKYCAPVAS